jgi:hypothetical protein
MPKNASPRCTATPARTAFVLILHASGPRRSREGTSGRGWQDHDHDHHGLGAGERRPATAGPAHRDHDHGRHPRVRPVDDGASGGSRLIGVFNHDLKRGFQPTRIEALRAVGGTLGQAGLTALAECLHPPLQGS